MKLTAASSFYDFNSDSDSGDKMKVDFQSKPFFFQILKSDFFFFSV